MISQMLLLVGARGGQERAGMHLVNSSHATWRKGDMMKVMKHQKRQD